MRKRNSIILAIVFACILVIAIIAYNVLTSSVRPDNNIVATAPGGSVEVVVPEGDAETGGSVEAGSDAEAEIEAEVTDVIPAPDFTFLDSGGNEVSFSDLRGKSVVLNFWASWCPPCKSEMPEFELAYLELGDEIQFVMLALTDGQRETIESATSYIEEEGFTFPVYFDSLREGAYAFGITSIPMTFFIDKGGDIIYWSVGAMDGVALRENIEKLQ